MDNKGSECKCFHLNENLMFFDDKKCLGAIAESYSISIFKTQNGFLYK